MALRSETHGYLHIFGNRSISVDQEELYLTILNLRNILKEGKLEEALSVIEGLKAADQADVVEELDESDQVAVITKLDPEESADVLEEMEDDMAASVAELLTPTQLAGILDVMEKDEAADVLNDIPDELTEETMRVMADPHEVFALMQYPEDTAGGIMTIAAITLSPHWTVQESLDELRRLGPRSDSSYYLYVTEEDRTLLGVVGLRDLVAEPHDTRIAYIMETDVISVQDMTDQEECARILSRYSHLVLPVVNKFNQFLGVITADDLLEVAEDEATEDMYLMAGIAGEERILGPISDSIIKRLPWLAINMLTLFVAITVIDAFEAVIAGLIVVAVFLPLVSGEGGNAGSQTATVIIRGLATGELLARDTQRVLIKELVVTVVNGAIIGLGTGLVVYFWKGESIIAIAIFLAMICNFAMAALTGVLVPLGLKKLKVDPALAAAAFVTAFTDTFGFLFFLGIVSLLI